MSFTSGLKTIVVATELEVAFVGFAPAQNPALTTFVMLSHPDLIYGGLASAPVFSAIMRYALRHFDIAPTGGQGLNAGTPVTGAP